MELRRNRGDSTGPHDQICYSGCFIKQGKIDMSGQGSNANANADNFNIVNPLIQQQNIKTLENPFQDFQINMLLQPSTNFENEEVKKQMMEGDWKTGGYQMAKVFYQYGGATAVSHAASSSPASGGDQTNEYQIECLEFAKDSKEKKMAIQDTRPYTLRNIYSRSLTMNDRLYIFHELIPFEESLSDQLMKTPVKIMDFKMKRIFNVDFKNTKEQLPGTHRINYSVCHFKNKAYIYGGLDHENKLISTMETFDAHFYKFAPVKYRGDSIPVARQGHQAIIMNQYTMVVIGGTYQTQLIDPQPIPENDSIWNYDLESGQWCSIKVKNQGLKNTEVNTQKSIKGSDVVPWNLVHHSACKLDSQNIGIMWYDPVISEKDQKTSRNMMISVFNVKKCLWRNLKLVQQDQNNLSMEFDFRFGQTLFPVHDVDCDRVNRILIFGGVNLKNPQESSSKLPYTQIDFVASGESFEIIESDDKDYQ